MKTLLSLSCAVALLLIPALLDLAHSYVTEGYGMHPLLALAGAATCGWLALASFRLARD